MEQTYLLHYTTHNQTGVALQHPAQFSFLRMCFRMSFPHPRMDEGKIRRRFLPRLQGLEPFPSPAGRGPQPLERGGSHLTIVPAALNTPCQEQERNRSRNRFVVVGKLLHHHTSDALKAVTRDLRSRDHAGLIMQTTRPPPHLQPHSMGKCTRKQT
jgi:hypothetical protein